MKRYIGIVVGVVAVIAAGVIISGRVSKSAKEAAQKLEFANLQRSYLERVGWLRANPDPKSYKDEVNPFLRNYFKDVQAHLEKFGGNTSYDGYVVKMEKAAEKGKQRKGPDPKVHYDYVRAVFDKMEKGGYEPTWSATDEGMRLDVFAEDKVAGGKPQVRLSLVLWGAQRSLKEDGKQKRMLTSASFNTQWKFTDEKGTLIAEMNAQDPSMKIDWPEQFIEEFPPMMVLGHYDMDLLPANVKQMEVTFGVNSRAPTGGEASAQFVWKLDVPREWKLGEGATWEGAEESVRPEEEIRPQAKQTP